MFRNIKNADGAVAPFEYLPCSAITPKNGMAMTLSGGKLAIASGTTKPSYICVAERDAAVAAGEIIPVTRVDDQTIFKTQLSATGTALNLGDKVTIASDGLRVTATTTSGVAEIVGMDGTAVGDDVYVRF